MDQTITNYCTRHEDVIRAIDMATWLNFKHRKRGNNILSVIHGPENDYAVVSQDILELFDNPKLHALPSDYQDMDYRTLDWLAQDPNPLEHWEGIRGAISTMDGEILRYIIHMDIPLEKFIRHELAGRGYDKNHHWCGFEKAKEILVEIKRQYYWRESSGRRGNPIQLFLHSQIARMSKGNALRCMGEINKAFSLVIINAE